MNFEGELWLFLARFFGKIIYINITECVETKMVWSRVKIARLFGVFWLGFLLFLFSILWTVNNINDAKAIDDENENQGEYSLQITTSGLVNIAPILGGIGIEHSDVNVVTTCQAGYSLSLATSVADNNLYLNGDKTINAENAYFAPSDGVATLGNTSNKWGYSMGAIVSGAQVAPTSNSVFSAVPGSNDSPAILKTLEETASVQDIDDDFDVYYGASARNGMASGTYLLEEDENQENGVLVYYLTANPTCDGAPEPPKSIKFVYGDHTFDGESYINSDIALFSSAMKGVDFDVSLDVASNVGKSGENQNWNGIVSDMLETTPWPGFVYRYSYTNKRYSYAANISTNSAGKIDKSITVASALSNVLITRRDQVVNLDGYGDGYSLDFSSWNGAFDIPLTFGANLEANQNPYRHFAGTLDNMAVKLYYDEATTVNLPVPTKTNYTFLGWNTAVDGSGTNYLDVPSIYVNSDLVLYAQWIKDDDIIFDTQNVTFYYGDFNFFGNNYLDTDLELFSREHFNYDFEITTTLDDFTPVASENSGRNVMFSCMDESNTTAYPGFAYRYLNTEDPQNEWSFATYATDTIKNKVVYPPTNIDVTREDRKIYFDGNYNLDFANIEGRFDIPLTFGASLDKNKNPYRFFTGSLSDVTVSLDYIKDRATTLPSPTIRKYEFVEWNTAADGSGTSYSAGETVTVTDDMELYAIWIYEGDIVRETYNITYDFGNLSFDSANYINTGLKLFSEDDYWRDFEITAGISNFVYRGGQDSIFSCMDESGVGSIYPGFVYRAKTATQMQIAANATSTIKIDKTYNNLSSVSITRTDEVLTVNNTDSLDMERIARTFDVPLTIGASLNKNGVMQRPFVGDLSSTLVTVAYEQQEETTLPQPTFTDCTFSGWTSDNILTPQLNVVIPAGNTEDLTFVANFDCRDSVVVFNANGGTVSEAKRVLPENTAVGALPTPIRAGYVFEGWYFDVGFTTLVDDAFVPTGRVMLYAKWKQDESVQNDALLQPVAEQPIAAESVGNNGSVSQAGIDGAGDISEALIEDDTKKDIAANAKYNNPMGVSDEFDVGESVGVADDSLVAGLVVAAAVFATAGGAAVYVAAGNKED